ncbi:MAG: MFS transporter [Acidimicrobiales bacterium]
MSPFVLACLAYLTVALPGSTLGLLWPSMRLSFHEPLGALGLLLAFALGASVISSAAVGRVLSRVGVGPLLAAGTALTAAALAAEALAPSLWVLAGGFVLFGFGFGSTDAALNAHAAHHFGARQINWMHASYGLGAVIGPLLVTALLGNGVSWRWSYGTMAIALAGLACVFALVHRHWGAPARELAAASPDAADKVPEPSTRTGRRAPRATVVLWSLTFAAVECGIESAAGIWGYVFLTAGRDLSHEAAGLAVAAYWAMMFVGRAVLGPVAERIGTGRVLSGAVVGVTAGAALMMLPGPGFVAVIGMMTLGLAAAPIFPLLTLTTGKRIGAGDVKGTTRMVSLQVAASSVGAAAVPAGIGLLIGTLDAKVLAPSLLLLGLAMCGVYGLLVHLTSKPTT